MSAPVVTQADIRAASPIAIKVMIGELEHDDLHQAFAAHRTAAEAASAATVAELERKAALYRGALREALTLMRGEPDMSLPGSDHWLWAKSASAAIAFAEGETA